MSKLIRRTAGTRKGAALIVALQLTALTFLSLVSFIGGPQQPVKAPADTQVSAPQAQTQTQTAQAQTETAQPLTATDKASLRKSAVFGKKLYEPRASQVFNLATSRAEAAESAQQSVQEGESPN